MDKEQGQSGLVPEANGSRAGYTSNRMPGACDLLDLPAVEAARVRWKWGERHLDPAVKIETTPESKGGRVPLLESIEEGLDRINYLTKQAELDRQAGNEDYRVILLRDSAIHDTNQEMRIARERGYGRVG